MSGRIAAPSYRRVYAEGRSVADRYLVLYHLPDGPGIKMGVSVSARLGKAVVRNKLRRRVKEAFRQLERENLSGQFVFIVRQKAQSASFQEIQASIRGLIKRMEAQ